MAPLTPPQAPLTWKHTVQDVEKLITQALINNKKVSDDIVKLPEDELDFDNVSNFFHPSGFRASISQPHISIPGLCEFAWM